MARSHIVVDVSSGEQRVVPYTSDEETQADLIKAADDLVQAPLVADRLRVAAIKANARRVALVNGIMTTDDAGIIAYINNNVTDLASAKVMLANLALLVAGVIRS